MDKKIKLLNLCENVKYEPRPDSMLWACSIGKGQYTNTFYPGETCCVGGRFSSEDCPFYKEKKND